MYKRFRDWLCFSSWYDCSLAKCANSARVVEGLVRDVGSFEVYESPLRSGKDGLVELELLLRSMLDLKGVLGCFAAATVIAIVTEGVGGLDCEELLLGPSERRGEGD